MHIDPYLFTEEAITAEVRAFVAEIEVQLAALPDFTGKPARVIRQARRDGVGILGLAVASDRAKVRSIPGPAGPVSVRVIHPITTPLGVYLHIHGGGWVIGDAVDQDLRLEALADATGLLTVSVDYRLAPEDPYPAGPDDCEAVAAWLVSHAMDEFGTEALFVGGESAGAHLSAVTILRMRDRHDYTGFVGANLVYGAYDLATTPSTRNWGDRDLILSTSSVQWFTAQFVPPHLLADPDVSPLHAQLHDLPPALFSVGTLDPLLDDTLFMAQRWLAAGNSAELAVYPGGIHAFDYFDTKQAAEAHARTNEFLLALLGAGTS